MGCANSKQVRPAEPEPGPVACAVTDVVEEQRIAEPGSVAFAETDEVEERRIVALLDSPNPDVLELRRLTPTQAAAAAEAAARECAPSSLERGYVCWWRSESRAVTSVLIELTN